MKIYIVFYAGQENHNFSIAFAGKNENEAYTKFETWRDSSQDNVAAACGGDCYAFWDVRLPTFDEFCEIAKALWRPKSPEAEALAEDLKLEYRSTSIFSEEEAWEGASEGLEALNPNTEVWVEIYPPNR